ncbi:alpha/beta hydrolase fold domain-containing protein [Nisaea sp.]|uniref:alpha/beta hydrolase fold domain-containing protein n=1 Tax=Nisaea sp. TaxID=2024842 RepID=UPI0032EC1596
MSEAADYSIDPQMAKAMERMLKIVEEEGLPPLPADPSPPESRVRMEAERSWWNQDLPEMADVREEHIDGPNGPIRVRLLYPDVPRPAPVLVYFHGGGWVVGSLETHHRAMRCLALESGCAVVAVDYRLAPEHKFPEPLQDCVAAIEHVREHGGDWGLDVEKIAVGGDSAGANLALGSALALRDKGDSPIRSLTLFYGCFERDLEGDSHTLFGDGSFGLSTASMRWYWNHYLRDDADAADPLACPMKADLAGLPPTQLYPAGLDPLRDDSILMRERMEAAGVPVEFKLYPGVCHAFINLTRMVDQAHELIGDAASAVRRNLSLG